MTMTMQPNLFDLPEPEPIPMMPCPTCHGHGVISALAATSRTGDPDTSQDAGSKRRTDVRRFSAKSRQAKLIQAIHREPLTAQEAAILVLGSDAPLSQLEACRRRVSDLLRAGYVCDSGVRRLNDGSPDRSIVWKITDEGIAARSRLALTGWSWCDEQRP